MRLGRRNFLSFSSTPQHAQDTGGLVPFSVDKISQRHLSWPLRFHSNFVDSSKALTLGGRTQKKTRNRSTNQICLGSEVWWSSVRPQPRRFNPQLGLTKEYKKGTPCLSLTMRAWTWPVQPLLQGMGGLQRTDLTSLRICDQQNHCQGTRTQHWCDCYNRHFSWFPPQHRSPWRVVSPCTAGCSGCLWRTAGRRSATPCR